MAQKQLAAIDLGSHNLVPIITVGNVLWNFPLWKSQLPSSTKQSVRQLTSCHQTQDLTARQPAILCRRATCEIAKQSYIDASLHKVPNNLRPIEVDVAIVEMMAARNPDIANDHCKICVQSLQQTLATLGLGLIGFSTARSHKGNATFERGLHHLASIYPIRLRRRSGKYLKLVAHKDGKHVNETLAA